MLATENLMKEHQLILKYVDLMERYAEFDLKNLDASILLEKANCFIEFIHEFADDFHHAKEEDILFRFLDVPGVLTHCNPVPQMLFEHNKARVFVQNMENTRLTKDINGLVLNAGQYAKLLKEHIYKEDNILYPMAERGLPDEAKLSLLTEYAETDNRLNSHAIWCKYETLYTELEQQLNLHELMAVKSCEYETRAKHDKG
jgi:hemerythrin-like domain-containing protein